MTARRARHARHARRARVAFGLAGIVLVAVALIVLRLLVYRTPAGDITWRWPDPSVMRFRATAVGVALTVGAALAVSGALLQTLLRNPLASPFVLGISSGAALGVMCGLYVGHAAEVVVPAPIAAGLGALVSIVIVYALGQRRGWLDPLSLILVGVVVSSMCAALILFLQHLVPSGLRGDLITWMAGSIGQGTPRTTLLVAAGVTLAITAVATTLGPAMDVATFGDDEARSVGLSLGRLRLVLFALAGTLAALAVMLAGPVAFVGLIAPHAARLLIGPRHTPLVVAAALVGGGLLVAADIVSQLVSVGGARMPVGVFTALLGGPGFIWLLRTGRGQT